MKITSADIKRLVLVRLNPGDDILLSLREAVQREGLKNALILEGVGSCITHHYHVVSSGDLPPEETFSKAEAPADIVNINGFVINGRVHSHIIFCNDKVAYGGHLEEGVTVLTFAIIVLAEVDADLEHYDRCGCIEDFT